MSKYESLWIYLKEHGQQNYELSYQTIEQILGFSIDHSFLNYKKDVQKYGYEVAKISIKNQKIWFFKLQGGFHEK